VPNRDDLQIPTTDAELSQLFGRKGGCAQGMISCPVHQKCAENPTFIGRPRLVESTQEQNFVQFCSGRQAERRPAAVQDIIDFMNHHGQHADRYWVNRFVERNAEALPMHPSAFLDADHHNPTPDDIKRYIMKIEPHLLDTSSSPHQLVQDRSQFLKSAVTLITHV
jgi:hypothetical protein